MAGKGASGSSNKAPAIALERVRVALDDISVSRPASGWRDIDEGRVREIKSLCYRGQLSLNIFGGVVLLDGVTDVDGKRIVDDGLSTILAWQQMRQEISSCQVL